MNQSIPEKKYEFLNTLLLSNDISNLVKEVSTYLNNPIAVYDSNYKIIAYYSSGTVRDDVWLTGMKRGYSRYEFATILSELNEEPAENAYYIITTIGPLRRRVGKTVIEHKTVGYYSVLENNSHIDSTSEDMYDFFAKLLAKELSNLYSRKAFENYDVSSNLIHDILDRNFASRTLFSKKLALTALNPDKMYALVVIDMRHYVKKKFSNEYMANSIQSFFKKCWSVFYKKYILLLIELDSPDSFLKSVAFENLTDYLKNIHLQGCIYYPITDLYQLSDYYDYCTLLLNEMPLDTKHKVIINCNDYKVTLAAYGLPKEAILNYCTAEVYEIYKNDIKNNTSYLETLYRYLESGKSLAKTSELLYVHRNTIQYRINRISEQYGIDFSDPQAIVQHLFSCILLKTHFHI